MANFSILTTEILNDPNLTQIDKKVLITLGVYADEEGWCCPKKNALASDINASPRSVAKSINKLCELEYIARHENAPPDKMRSTKHYKVASPVDQGQKNNRLIQLPNNQSNDDMETKSVSLPLHKSKGV